MRLVFVDLIVLKFVAARCQVLLVVLKFVAARWQMLLVVLKFVAARWRVLLVVGGRMRSLFRTSGWVLCRGDNIRILRRRSSGSIVTTLFITILRSTVLSCTFLTWLMLFEGWLLFPRWNERRRQGIQRSSHSINHKIIGECTIFLSYILRAW